MNRPMEFSDLPDSSDPTPVARQRHVNALLDFVVRKLFRAGRSMGKAAWRPRRPTIFSKEFFDGGFAILAVWGNGQNLIRRHHPARVNVSVPELTKRIYRDRERKKVVMRRARRCIGRLLDHSEDNLPDELRQEAHRQLDALAESLSQQTEAHNAT